jgi:hypothetical protein
MAGTDHEIQFPMIRAGKYFDILGLIPGGQYN